MKRIKRNTSLILIILGATLIALAPLWRFAIGPAFIKLPEDLTVISDYRGTLKIFADQATMRFLPEGQAQTVRLTIHAQDRTIESKGDRLTMVMEERVEVKNADTGQLLQGLRPSATYVLDRKTCMNVPGFIDGIDREGYSIKFPMLSGKKTYGFWDDELADVVESDFVRETKMDGLKNKGIKVYVYRASDEMKKMKTPPAGLPANLTGKQLKEMGMEVPLPDSSRIALEYYKKIDLVQYVEPKTGMVVFVEKNYFEYYVKNAPGQSPPYLKLAAAEYHRTSEGAKKDLDAMVRYIRLIDLDLTGAPLSYLLTGILLLIVGILLGRRRKAEVGGENESGPEVAGENEAADRVLEEKGAARSRD